MFRTLCVHHQEDHLYIQFLLYVYMLNFLLYGIFNIKNLP